MDCTPEAPRAGKTAHGLSYPDVYPSASRAPAPAALVGNGSAGGTAEARVQGPALTQLAHSATGSSFNLSWSRFLPERKDKIASELQTYHSDLGWITLYPLGIRSYLPIAFISF